MGIGFLVVRLVLGLGIAAHGAQKLFGWFGGYGLKGTGGFFDGLGFRPGTLFAFAAGLGEFGGGVLTALGLFGPVGPALMILVMIVAALSVHVRNGFFVTSNGVEVPGLYMMGALALLCVGPTPYSLDAALDVPWLWAPKTVAIALAAAVVLAGGNLAIRKAPAPTTT